MKNLIDISTAFAWFVLCIAAALFLLLTAVIYSGYLSFRRSSKAKKIEFSKIQIAR